MFKIFVFITYLSLALAAPILPRQASTTAIAVPSILPTTALESTSTVIVTNVSVPIGDTTQSIGNTTLASSNTTNTITPIPLSEAFVATSLDPNSIVPSNITDAVDTDTDTDTDFDFTSSIPTTSSSPTSSTTSETTSTETVLPTSNVNAQIFATLRRSAEFTNAAYCSSTSVAAWKCGITCDALGNITVLSTGGDNGLIPDYYVAYDPTIQSIVVSHQGTDPTSLLSLSVDAQFLQSPLNGTLFPTAPNNTLVHDGFQEAFLSTAEDVRSTVLDGLQKYQSNKVLVTGHSLGAAIGVFDGVYLRGVLGDEVSVTTHVFGLPRVGNSVWAGFVDATMNGTLFHMHLAHDPIPTVPPRGILDYTHPSGEIFDPLTDPTTSASSSTSTSTDISTISSSRRDVVVDATNFLDGSTAVFCPGRENENCSLSNEVLADNILDHLGPYLTVQIGSLSCTN